MNASNRSILLSPEEILGLVIDEDDDVDDDTTVDMAFKNAEVSFSSTLSTGRRIGKPVMTIDPFNFSLSTRRRRSTTGPNDDDDDDELSRDRPSLSSAAAAASNFSTAAAISQQQTTHNNNSTSAYSGEMENTSDEGDPDDETSQDGSMTTNAPLPLSSSASQSLSNLVAGDSASNNDEVVADEEAKILLRGQVELEPVKTVSVGIIAGSAIIPLEANRNVWCKGASENNDSNTIARRKSLSRFEIFEKKLRAEEETTGIIL